MAAMPRPRLTAAEYLKIERASDWKSEFYDGRMFLRAGASKEHNQIAVNFTRELSNRLRRGPCRVYTGDMRVKVSATVRYTYPDLVVGCGELKYEDAEVDTLLNPTLIIEILSPSTESYDRGGKTLDYRTIPSLQEYLLVAQDRPHIERYVRGEDDTWTVAETEGLDAILSLTAIGCELPLADLYEDVPFPPVP